MARFHELAREIAILQELRKRYHASGKIHQGSATAAPTVGSAGWFQQEKQRIASDVERGAIQFTRFLGRRVRLTPSPGQRARKRAG
jgi:hypothetical protein